MRKNHVENVNKNIDSKISVYESGKELICRKIDGKCA